MQPIRAYTQKFWKTATIVIFLIAAFVAGNITTTHQTHVLAADTHIVPTPTPTPIPTSVPVTIINNIYVPTQSPVVLPTQSPTPSPVPPTLTPEPSSVPTITPTSTPTPTPTLTPTPTQASQSIEVDIDYAGEHAASTYTVVITSGETAWQAVQDTVGIANIQYTDYGGSLGIFITGFNGIDASSNQYYDFQVNGTSSNVGVSSYAVVDHDVLKFVLTGF